MLEPNFVRSKIILVINLMFSWFCSCYNFTGFTIRTVNRPGSQLLGANGRDDGALVSNLPFSYADVFGDVIVDTPLHFQFPPLRSKFNMLFFPFRSHHGSGKELIIFRYQDAMLVVFALASDLCSGLVFNRYPDPSFMS